MDERPPAPPEGRLLAEALTRTGMSIREAAGRAGISYGRWRQITSGYQNVSPGSYAEVRAPAMTVARMARVVGVKPADLIAAGRPDAATALESLPDEEPGERGHTVSGLTRDEKADVESFLQGLRIARGRQEATRFRPPGQRSLAAGALAAGSGASLRGPASPAARLRLPAS